MRQQQRAGLRTKLVISQINEKQIRKNGVDSNASSAKESRLTANCWW